MGIINSKKGFMFTLVAIFLISIFVFVLYASTSRVFIAKETLEAERTEAVMMNAYIDSFTDRYMDTFVHIAGRNALKGMVSYVEVLGPGVGIDSPDEFMAQVFANGTIQASYDITSTSSGLDMILLARNGTDSIAVETMEMTGATASFGGETVLAQHVVGEEGNPLDSLDRIYFVLENTDDPPDSDDIYVLVYDDSYALRAIDHQHFEDEDGDFSQMMNFTFGANLPFDADHGYYIVLAAPFEIGTTYRVNVASSGDPMEEWTVLTEETGTIAQIPLDFYLTEAVISENSLLGLVNNFATFGTDSMNVQTAVNITEVFVQENSPWTIKANATVLLSSTKTTVTFTDVVATGEADVRIVGLSDPFNLLMPWSISIEISNTTVDEDFGTFEFYYHVRDQTFVFNENGPSFLERFRGAEADSSSCCGIQTMLNYDDVITAFPDDEDRGYSYVDYKFARASECNIDDSRYVYAISSDPTVPGSWDDPLWGSSGPYYQWEDVEFYHADDSVEITFVATCPASTE
jgi:hypothetical protein